MRHETETPSVDQIPPPMLECPGPERLRRVAAIIDAAPDLYDQHSWVGRNTCGTTHCIAGWAMADAGYRDDPEREVFYRPDGAIVINEVDEGATLLGLSIPDAEHLFMGVRPAFEDDTVGDVLRKIADGADVRTVWSYT